MMLMRLGKGLFAALAVGVTGLLGAPELRADGFDPAYDGFLARKAYTIPQSPGVNVTGLTISTFKDRQNNPGALTIGSVGVMPPPPDLANPRFNFIPERDYGQGAGLNLRFGF